MFQYLDSLYHNFSKASDRRYELGETNYLEKITALAKYKQVETQLQQLNYEKKAQLSFLQSSIQSGDSILIKTNEIKPLIIDLENNNTLIFNYLESVCQTRDQLSGRGQKGSNDQISNNKSNASSRRKKESA